MMKTGKLHNLAILSLRPSMSSDHIDREELRKSYLANIPQLGL